MTFLPFSVYLDFGTDRWSCVQSHELPRAHSSAFSLCPAFYSAFPSAAIFPQPEKQSLIRDDAGTVSGVENFLGLCCPESISPERCFLEDAFTEHTSLGRPFLCSIVSWWATRLLITQPLVSLLHLWGSLACLKIISCDFLQFVTHPSEKLPYSDFQAVTEFFPFLNTFCSRTLPGCLIKHCVTSPLLPCFWDARWPDAGLPHWIWSISPSFFSLFSSCITWLGIYTFQKFFSQFWKVYCQTHPLSSEFFLLCFLFPMLKFLFNSFNSIAYHSNVNLFFPINVWTCKKHAE